MAKVQGAYWKFAIVLMVLLSISVDIIAAQECKGKRLGGKLCLLSRQCCSGQCRRPSTFSLRRCSRCTANGFRCREGQTPYCCSGFCYRQVGQRYGVCRKRS